MKPLKVAGKFLDQPILVAKIEQQVPSVLTGAGVLYTAHEVKKSGKENRNKALLKVGVTMFFTVLSALAAPKIVNKIFKNPTKTLSMIKEENANLVDRFLKETVVDLKTKQILQKAKDKVLNLKEINYLDKSLSKKDNFLNRLIPEPENISSKEIFSEIGRLSLLGFIPVVGGIFGGIAGDMVTTRKWQERVPDKLKEGAYQYLANIFLCNVGAGMALALMEKFGIKGKTSRALGMTAGIVSMGIVGGSAIANTIGNKIINPICGKKTTSNIYSERKPEALDIGLHVDDIATVAVMSGLKWIEPALPIMYAISGYRAGIGYRNVNKCNEKIRC